MKITILNTFVFSADKPPFSFLGHWGCAYTKCPKGGRVQLGETAHKIQIDEDVDLIHQECLVDMKKELGL